MTTLTRAIDQRSTETRRMAQPKPIPTTICKTCTHKNDLTDEWCGQFSQKHQEHNGYWLVIQCAGHTEQSCNSN